MKWKRDWGLSVRMWATMLLLLLVYLVFIGILSALGFGMWWLVLIAGGFALVQYFYSDKLVLWSTGARIIDEDENPGLYRMVAKLAADADLPMPRLAVMQSPVPNAFATGRSPSHAVVAVTDSITRLLTQEELEAVLAHELSHVKNRDVRTLTIASFVAMLAFILMRNWFFLAIGGRRDSPWILVVIASVVVWVIATLLTRMLSRYREFAADRGSAYITGSPRALMSALEKISGRMDRVPPQKKKEVEGANAFFIIPALSGSTLMELFSTHPPLEKRLHALSQLEEEMNR
ncbi:MAG: zinc metalloprotease HtpX [Methanomicrobiales archaeon]